MTDREIRTAFERDGYVVVEDLIDARDLEPIREFIEAKVDAYSRELYSEGKLSSCHEDESFGRRYAAVCEELDILPRSWDFGMFGPEFFDLYNLPGAGCRLPCSLKVASRRGKSGKPGIANWIESNTTVTRTLGAILRRIFGALRDLAPIILVIAFFQIAVLQQPFPNLGRVAVGLVCVIAGLTFFIQGLESGLFPLGEAIAQAFARKGSATALLIFAFCLGFGTTVAEPALIAVAAEAAEVAAEAGVIAADDEARAAYAFELRMVVAVSVGAAIVLGVLRILKGWPIHRLIIGGYVLVTAMTAFAPAEIIGVAYDSGGVTTSTITVPLVTALGVGLATSIRGRNPMVDGFGLIAFASLMPMIFVLAYGMVV